MHAPGCAEEQAGIRHRIEHARASEDVAVDPSQRGDHHHGGREVGAARPEQRPRGVRRHQRGGGDPVRSEDEQVRRVEREVEDGDDGDGEEGGERQVAPGLLHLPADVAGGDPAVEGEERADQRRPEARDPDRVHRGDQIRRRACAAGERQHDQTGDHRELGEGDDVLRPDPLPHAEHVHPGERGENIGLPSFNTIVGLMLESGRLPGAAAFVSAPTKPK